MKTNSLLVIVPSRGRPQAIADLRKQFAQTAVCADLWVVVDEDDPELSGYREVADDILLVQEPRRLGPSLNYAVSQLDPDRLYIGFMGDDHRPRTFGWDLRFVEALKDMGSGIVYGNDLIQGENLPTAVFMTADIPKTLGYMSPPTLLHMYLDNTWRTWGDGAHCLRYLGDVIIEHVHPLKHRAPIDKTYEDAWSVMSKDGESYEEYVSSGQMATDVGKIAALNGA